MRYAIRILIHNNEYHQLHERAEQVSLSRTGVDSATGKRVHLPNGTYETEAYTSAEMALLAARAAALLVDPHAEISVSGNGQLLTYGCREVEVNPFDGLFGSLFQSSVPVPSSDFINLLAKPTDTVPSGGFCESILGKPANESKTVPDTLSTSFWEAFGKAS